jgi:hypothetical protein
MPLTVDQISSVEPFRPIAKVNNPFTPAIGQPQQLIHEGFRRVAIIVRHQDIMLINESFYGV